MPVMVKWDNDDHTIVLQQYTVENISYGFYEAVDQTAELMNSVDHPVDLIIQVPESGVVPRSLLKIAQHANDKQSDNQRLVIVIGADTYLKMMVDLVGKVAPKLVRNSHFVNTLDEAYAIIDRNPIQKR